ncbi:MULTISPECIES: PP2C family serine/threonine-protein phosphatase [unclassified Paenibacillus]|uniref:PP2C family protein-serine/threonine phosphatase n=1 Tax=unclassified Paenibacillus TaxID=185978 RepID=UPI00114152EA|nr:MULTISPECIES: PP2C family serine/threonine-protein phosphatase [unclassified Paenibacillus]
MKKTIAVHWHYGAATHSGWHRATNDDRSLIRIGLTAGGTPYAVAALADGMGGLGAGGAAGDAAMEGLRTWLEERLSKLLDRKDRWSAFEREAVRQFQTIHGQIVEQSHKQGERQGTTLTLLLLIGAVYLIVHIGDCRVYKFSPGQDLKRLTRDHTWVNGQVRRGLMSNETARKHPKRNVLLSFLGMNGNPRVEVQSGLYTPGTLFLLSSDGFHGSFPETEIRVMLTAARDRGEGAQAICDELLSRTLEHRAADNISILVLKAMDRHAGDNPILIGLKLFLHRLRRLRLSSYFLP